MGDTQRANVGKRHRTSTPIRGTSADFDSEEPTPAPVQVDFDSTMPLDEQVIALRGAVNEQARATARTWGMRDAGDRLDRLDNKQDIASNEISELSALIREFLMPAVKSSQARIDILLSHHETNRIRVEMFYDREWPAAVKALEGMTERLGRVERGQERQEHEMRGMSERLNANHGALSQRVTAVESYESRIALLERDKRDTDITTKALARRSRTITGFLSAVIGALAGLASTFLK